MIVDKPSGPTSRRVMEAARRAVGATKAGHAGTLDPMASGVLVVLLGEGTKLSPWLMGQGKAYEATVRFGIGTDTLDAQGEVLDEVPVMSAAWTPEALDAAVAQVAARSEQVPPAFSALKRGGETLMARARRGERIDIAPRPAVCHEASRVAMGPLFDPTADITLRCGSGYYVRAFARDVGAVLGVPAHLAALRRTAVGPFALEDATPLDALSPADVRPLAESVPHVPTVRLEGAQEAAAIHGRGLGASLGREADAHGRALLIRADGQVLAMAHHTERGWRVLRGFRHAQPADPAVPEPMHDVVDTPGARE